jgi:intein/homing endonuclease
MSNILKKGECGFGILIESDSGYISAELNKEIIAESFQFKENEPVMITCILQKWGVKNKNGRIYSKEVLLPQILEYQKLVDNNQAMGECFSPDTKILTKEGWKVMKDISETENILTLNRMTNKAEYQIISKKIYEDHSGDMYHIKSTNIDIKVTPYHRFLIADRNDNLVEVRASELFENISENKYFNGKYKIIKKINWHNDSLSDFEFGKIKIKPELFYAFMGIYLSEGCVLIKDRNIQITQKKEVVITKIENLLNKTGLYYNKRTRKNGTVDFVIENNALFEYLKPLGKASKKYISTELKNGSADLLKILVDWFQLGDGRNVKYSSLKGQQQRKNSVFSTSKKLIYDLNEILYKSGRSGNITIDTKRNDRVIIDDKYSIINGEEIITKTERVIKRINSKALFNLNLSETEHIYLDRRSIKVNKYHYDGKVVCVQVPNETIFVMRNGKALWTLNCDHPDSSVISLQNISHMITKMWWGTDDNENTLYGKLKLIVSPGFIRSGVVSVIGDKILLYVMNKMKLGISSRGVGTLKEIRGENYVQDDFELISFDLVSSPSTPGAFLFPDNGEKPIVTTKKLSENEDKMQSALDIFLL